MAASFTGLSLGAGVDVGSLCLTHPVISTALAGAQDCVCAVRATVAVFPEGEQEATAALQAAFSAGVQEATACLHAAISAGVQLATDFASLQNRMQHPGGHGGQNCAATWVIATPEKKSRVINTCFMSS